MTDNTNKPKPTPEAAIVMAAKLYVRAFKQRIEAATLCENIQSDGQEPLGRPDVPFMDLTLAQAALEYALGRLVEEVGGDVPF
jgi:hypothetical protein